MSKNFINKNDKSLKIVDENNFGANDNIYSKILNFLDKNEESRICYIAFSEKEKNRASKIIKKISNNSNLEVDIYLEKKDKYLKKLGYAKKVSDAEDFKIWYVENYDDFLGINYLTVWKEIMSIITGSINKNFYYDVEYSEDLLSGLYSNKYKDVLNSIIVDSEEGFYIKNDKSLIDIKLLLEEYNSILANNIYKNLLEGYIGSLKKESYLTFKEYQSFSNEDDGFKYKKHIYSIFKNYILSLKYLDGVKLSNFICTDILDITSSDYDFLIIDGVEKFTERELLLFILRLSNKNNMILIENFDCDKKEIFLNKSRLCFILKTFELDIDNIVINYKNAFEIDGDEEKIIDKARHLKNEIISKETVNQKLDLILENQRKILNNIDIGSSVETKLDNNYIIKNFELKIFELSEKFESFKKVSMSKEAYYKEKINDLEEKLIELSKLM